jgi:hypothetical protein
MYSWSLHFACKPCPRSKVKFTHLPVTLHSSNFTLASFHLLFIPTSLSQSGSISSPIPLPPYHSTTSFYYHLTATFSIHNQYSAMASFDEVIESIRITEFDGDLWPCFVFPDHSVPDGSIERRPNMQALPVLILRRHLFVWRNRDELADFNPFTPREFGGDRKKAFTEALEYNNLDYYHNLAWNKQAARNLDVEVDDDIIVLSDNGVGNSNVKPRKHASTTPVTKKRPSSVFKRPGLPSPSPTPIKKSKPSSKVGSSLPFTEDESDDELPHPSTFTITPTRKPAPKPAVTPWKPSGKKFKIPENDYVTRKQLELHMTEKGDGKPSHEVKVIEPVNE